MTEPAASPVWDEAFEEVLRPLLPLLPEGEPLGAELDLRAAGLDSLGTVELLTNLEYAYDVEVPDELLTFEIFASPAALWKVISSLRAGSE
ncbi:phosphopantetheine-binding protein [Streptomyces sp. URMC 123]|uniref:phosphopantetheine-binding protein n=1 Tax=Streptomyces sp. URMC 123 TaxID=3423403 RepID=UPI003F1BE53E